MSDPVDVSKAPPGEVADCPSNGGIFNTYLRDSEGEESGYLIKWRTSVNTYIMADEDSHVSLDDSM